jgi:hypothetical protein
MKGPTQWRLTTDDLKKLHQRCKDESVAVVVGVVSDLPPERTRTSVDEFRAILSRDLALKPQFVLTLSSTPNQAEVCIRFCVQAMGKLKWQVLFSLDQREQCTLAVGNKHQFCCAFNPLKQ